ncbi:MAG: hypothetical protein LBN22_07230 [Clostridiales Family XIII bacterium]|jgi:hypothetical protein|nr:hypothetical protein [Clostridiales Family XIII bacterium]
MIIEEVKKILRRKQCYLILGLFLIGVFVDFIITCLHYKSAPLSTIPSAYDLIIINNDFGTPASMIFSTFIFFLAISIISSDILFDEVRIGLSSSIITRESTKKYIVSKMMAIAITVFFITIIPLFINQLLSVIAFPVQGKVSGVITYNELMPADPDRILSYLENFHPYINIVIFILLRGIAATVTALFAFSLTFIEHVSKFFILLAPMLYYICYSIIKSFIQDLISDTRAQEIVDTDILNVNGYGSIYAMIFFLLIQIIIGVMVIRNGLKNEVIAL